MTHFGELAQARKTGRVWECRRHVGGKVGSKLQKKLIKNEKRQRREDGREERGERSGRKQRWVDGEGRAGEENREKKKEGMV